MLRFAITPGDLVSIEGIEVAQLVARCAELASAGVDFVLLREKRLAAEQVGSLAKRVGEAVAGAGMKVVLPGIGAGEAFGRHLRLEELPAAGWVSVSCHTVEEVRLARERRASAVLFAPVFGKTVDGVEVVPGTGLGTLREACRAAREVPVFALGGLNEGNARDCVRAGAAGVAGIRMFFGRDG